MKIMNTKVITTTSVKRGKKIKKNNKNSKSNSEEFDIQRAIFWGNLNLNRSN